MKFNSENLFIYIFLVIVFTLLVLAAIGYLSGRWEPPPT